MEDMTLGALDALEMPTGMDWMNDVNWDTAFNVGKPEGSQWSWLTNQGGPTATGGGDWWTNLQNFGTGLGKLAPIGELGKAGFGAWQAIDRASQMADYNKQYADWVKAQNDYIKQKQQYEADFMKQFAGAQEGFAGAQEEFQGQLGAASEQANQVFGEFMKASKPLLAQSQEMMTGAVEALARGETPEHWQPILDQAKQRAMATGIQSLISGGMSPEAAAAAMQPIVDQQAQTMVMQLGDQLTKSGLATGQLGQQGLQGAGQMTQVLGQLAQMGMVPEMQEFQAMASVLGHILGGGGQMVPPGKPSA